ncbi:MAG TPA: hypothetical protein VMF04_01660 [Thermoplasmata archaeon]|nr:hypothetical protein [Thermoplasmata archaeon]
MNHAATLLEKVARQIEPEVQKQLAGLFGGIVRSYLPQAWVFETDEGTATLVVEKTGAASVRDGAADHPDVTLRVPYAPLARALQSRKPMSPDAVTVTPHTAKGRTAFDYLRSRVGL